MVFQRKQAFKFGVLHSYSEMIILPCPCTKSGCLECHYVQFKERIETVKQFLIFFCMEAWYA